MTDPHWPSLSNEPVPSELEIAAFLQTLGEMLGGDYRYHDALDRLRDCVANRRLAALAEFLKTGGLRNATPAELLGTFEYVDLRFAAAIVGEYESRGEIDLGFIEAAAQLLERAGRGRGFRHFG